MVTPASKITRVAHGRRLESPLPLLSTSAQLMLISVPRVGTQVSRLPGRASSITPGTGGSNIQNQYRVLPAKFAAQVNHLSYASAEQRENTSLPTWKTSGVDALSSDSISSTFLHTPTLPLALPNGEPPAQGGDTDPGKQLSALDESHELARTKSLPAGAPEGCAGASICPNDALRQTSTSMVYPSITPSIVEGASGESSPTDIQRGPMVSTGGISTHESDVMGDDPQPVLKLRGLPAEEFEGNVLKLKDRLLRKGAEPTAVGVCTRIFSEGISIAALEVSMTREESKAHGVVGKRYRMLLEKRAELGGTKNRCRLCSGSVEYKNHRDALRHLLKDHFGMGYECKYNWYVGVLTWEIDD